MSRLRTIVASRWFKILISAALLAVLLYKTDRQQMRAALAAADLGWLALAWLLLIVSQILSAYRWALLARGIGFDESLQRFCLYYFSAMYVNLFGPGTVAGDVGRVLYLAGGRRRALALTSVVAHRATGFVAILWIAATGIVLLPEPVPAAARWLTALVVPATIGGWLWGPRLAARLLPASNRWRLLVERDLAPYWHDRRLLALSIAWAMAMHGLQIVAQAQIARSLGLELPWTFFLVVVPLTNVIGTLPFSLQGVGVREAGYWSYLAGIGVASEPALAMGLLTSAVVIASNLAGLPAFLLLRGDRQGPLATGEGAAESAPADERRRSELP